MITTKRLKPFDRDWRYKPIRDVKYYWVRAPDVTYDVIHEFVDFCLIWCVRKFGEASGLDIPEIDLSRNDRSLGGASMIGLYDHIDNVIHVRIQGHRTFYNLAKTVIHEYVHYLQPRSGNWYDRYYERHGYYNHPYEIEAYHLADLYGVECARWVMHQMELLKTQEDNNEQGI